MCNVTSHHFVIDLQELLLLVDYRRDRLGLVWKILVYHHWWWVPWLVLGDILLIFHRGIFKRNLWIKRWIMMLLWNVSWLVTSGSLGMRWHLMLLLMMWLSHQYIVAWWFAAIFNCGCLQLLLLLSVLI